MAVAEHVVGKSRTHALIARAIEYFTGPSTMLLLWGMCVKRKIKLNSRITWNYHLNEQLICLATFYVNSKLVPYVDSVLGLVGHK